MVRGQKGPKTRRRKRRNVGGRKPRPIRRRKRQHRNRPKSQLKRHIKSQLKHRPKPKRQPKTQPKRQPKSRNKSQPNCHPEPNPTHRLQPHQMGHHEPYPVGHHEPYPLGYHEAYPLGHHEPYYEPQFDERHRKHHYDSRADYDPVNLMVRGNPHSYSSERNECCKSCSSRLFRDRIRITRVVQIIFVGVAFALAILSVLPSKNIIYPPGGTGGHSELLFILTAGALGIISFLFGFLSSFAWYNCLNRIADEGDKRRVFRYTTVLIDTIFIGIAIGAMVGDADQRIAQYAWTHLGEGGTQCAANMGSQACAMLMAATVLTGLGVIAAVAGIVLEFIRIRKWKKGVPYD